MAVITSSLERNENLINSLIPWLVCITGGLLFFYESIQMNMFNSLNTALMASFHTNATDLGLLTSVYFYTNASLVFVAGNLLDRFSTRKLILFSMTCCTLGTFIFSLAPSMGVAVIGRFLVGIGGAFCFLSSVKLASRWFPPARMALIVGVIVTMYMFGGMVAQTPLAMAVHHFGWRYAVFLDGMLGVALTAFMWAIIKDRPEKDKTLAVQETRKLETLGLKRSIVLVLLNRQNWYGAFYTSLMNLPVYIIGAFMGSLYLTQVDHMSVTQASMISSMVYFGSMIGSPTMGWVSDKIGYRRVPMIIAAIISIALVLYIIYTPHPPMLSLLLSFFALGFITSAQVIGYPTVSEHNPHVLTGTAVSIVSMIVVLSGAVLLPVVGWILDVSGAHKKINNVIHYSAGAYHHALVILPATFVIALLMAILIKETRCKPQCD